MRLHKIQFLLLFLFSSMVGNTFAQNQLPDKLQGSQLTPALVNKLLNNPEATYMLATRPSESHRQLVEIFEMSASSGEAISRTPTHLQCHRVHQNKNGQILCLSNFDPTQSNQQYSMPVALLYDSQLKLQKKLFSSTENHLISRARMSPNGQWSSWTFMTPGDSYLEAGSASFSTEAWLVANGPKNEAAVNLETWPLFHQKQLVKAVDKNIWGVSFSPTNPDLFYVTAFFKGKPYLAKGSLQNKKLETIKEGIECPSVSPNGLMIAFKKRVSSNKWAPAVMNLQSGKETVFKQAKHSVDDQIEWLDHESIVYHINTNSFFGKNETHLMRLDIIRGANAQAWFWVADAYSPGFKRNKNF